MTSTTKLQYTSRRGQEVILVLYALSDMGGIRRRREVLDHISNCGWYEVIADDLVPTRSSREARYRIDLAWARKDGVLADCIENFEKDSWELNRRGRTILENVTRKFATGEFDLSRCEFFTAAFKRVLKPDFEASAADKKRVPRVQRFADLERLLEL